MNAIVIAALLLAQPQAPMPPQAPPIRVEPSKQAFLEYTAGAAQAAATGKPLVTFLGCLPRTVAGATVCYAETLPGYTAPAVIVAVPRDGWLDWKATLPAAATDAMIRGAVTGLFGQASATSDCGCSFGGACRCLDGCKCGGQIKAAPPVAIPTSLYQAPLWQAPAFAQPARISASC